MYWLIHINDLGNFSLCYLNNSMFSHTVTRPKSMEVLFYSYFKGNQASATSSVVPDNRPIQMRTGKVRSGAS
jgi:hypothetical protein